jgi:RHS repeat-associated protein
LTRSQAAAGYTTNTYDGAGNLLKSLAPGNQRTTNTWDGENRLTQVALPSVIIDTFAYNGDGQRVQKQDSSGTTKHVWDRQNIVVETDGTNAIQVVYTLELAVFGNLVSQRRGSTTSFYLFDVSGTTRQLVNAAEIFTDTYLYDCFGNILATTGSTGNSFLYVGRLGYYNNVDDLSYYLRTRFYSQGTGRFRSRDPLGTRASLNLYNYVGSNPANVVDPSGLVPPPVCCRDQGPFFGKWVPILIGASAVSFPSTAPNPVTIGWAKTILCVAVRCVKARYRCEPACFAPPTPAPDPPPPMNAVTLTSLQLGTKTIDIDNPQATDIQLHGAQVNVEPPPWWPPGLPWFPPFAAYQQWGSGADCAKAEKLCLGGDDYKPTPQTPSNLFPFPNSIVCVAGSAPASIPCNAVKPYQCPP